MKTFVLVICSLISLASCQNEQEIKSKAGNDTANFTSIYWIDSVKNIGSVVAGTTTAIKFRFRNTGTRPLFIIAARPGCGCTVADYPKEAIAPNAEGVITAEYSVNKSTQGDFRKNISITANTLETTTHNIFFYGRIIKEGEADTVGR